jgi:pimeloyl-ACP methyl ester carboxylesterase
MNDKRRRSSCLKRILLGSLVAVAVLLIAGIVYQAIGSTMDARRLQAPGELFDVGDYQMHLHCTGDGNPTVILEALSGGMSSYWAWVQPEVAKVTRVCSYDRAGRGWSEKSPENEDQDLWTTAERLQTLLNNAGEQGPYVLVGHSIGGLYVRAFTQQHRDEVAGIVLLDSAHPEQFDRYPEMAAATEAYLQQSAVFPTLARIGLFRLYFALGGEIDFQELPPQQHDEVAALWSSPSYFHSQRAEVLAAPLIYEQGQTLTDLGSLPLTVITADTQQPAGWVALQEELATLSDNAVHEIISGATHASLIFNPDHAAATSNLIIQMVETVRSTP